MTSPAPWLTSLAVLGLAAIAAPAQAQEGGSPSASFADGEPLAPTAIANVYGRDSYDLSGQWAYIVDPMRMGFRAGRMRSFHRDLTPQNQELIEYHWETSPKMTIPGDWTSQVRELEWYEGLVWFRTDFEADRSDGERAFLHFEAVNYHAHVYLNGELVGEHVGGFTPFSIEVTDHLRDGENLLVVGADSTHSETGVPGLQVDWWNYGGVTRPVHLVQTPETFVRGYTVGLDDEGRIAADVTLDGPGAAGQVVSVSIEELGLVLEGETDADGRVEFAAEAEGLDLWAPGNAKLYDVSIEAGADSVSERIGFRTIEVDGPRILLNGEPVFMRGISMHEEAIGERATRTLTWAGARGLLEEARALGANYVRLSHYPHSEKMTRLADELGLMVWSEIPVYWDMDFGNPETLGLARTMLAEMIERDINRASVVIWSVGNETLETDERLSFMRRLIDDARERDPSRLVSAALHDDADSSSGPDGWVTIDDALGEYVDVIAFNRYEAWYGIRNPEEIYQVNWRTEFDKPIIFSEFGADALLGYRADPLERWSEDYQALLYENTLEMALRIPNIAGTSPWILKDFRSPRRFHGTYQEYWNRKGLIDPAGNRKLAFEVVRDWYAERAAEDEEARR